jgi:hypothetical protein
VSGIVRSAWRTSRARGWHDPALGVAIGMACLLFMAGPLLPGAGQRNWAVPALYNILQFGLPTVAAVRLADAAIEQGASASGCYLVVAVVVPIFGVWLFGPLLMPLLGSDPGWSLVNDLWLWTGTGVLLALGLAAYAHWRAGERALARQHAAEGERACQLQRLHAARLLALQARVEPELLFATLDEVRARAGDGSTQDDDAERLLADLIGLLRRLLPSAQANRSTLARELALVQAQARLGAQAMARHAGPGQDDPPSAMPRLHPLPRVVATLPAECEHVEFAPLVLPALLRLLDPSGSRPWFLTARRIAADSADPRLLLELRRDDSAATGPVAADTHTQAAVLLERLQAVLGPSARLDLSPHGEIAAMLDLPWCPVPPSDVPANELHAP